MSADTDQLVVNEYPDDGVAIGESPDGDRLSGAQARHLLTTRRKLLIGLGTLGTVAAIAEAELGGSGDSTLWGGTMALDKAYKIGPRTYMGPDSAKAGVLSEISDDEGWKYEAVDTEVNYWLDDGAWQGPMGVGSSGTKAGPSHFQSLSTEVADVGTTVINAIYRDPDDGSRKTESYDTIQAAIDAIPLETDGDNFSAAMGYVEFISQGDTDSTAYQPSSQITLNKRGTRFIGSGIHAKILGNVDSGPVIDVTQEDTEIAYFWVDNDGTGDCIELSNNCHIHDVNIDHTGRYGLHVQIGDDYSVVGPNVEIKAGPTSALRLQGHCYVTGYHAIQLNAGTPIARGIEILGGSTTEPIIIDGAILLGDGSNGASFGIDAKGAPTLATNVHVGPTDIISGATIPTVPYRINQSNFWGYNLREAGGGGNRIDADADNVYLSGRFPSGWTFRDPGVSTVGGVVIHDPKLTPSDISEQTAGNAEGQVLNREFITPPTESLGGTDGPITPTDAPVDVYHVRVDAGGSATELESVDGIGRVGRFLVIEHTGGENVTVVHDDTGESNPLLNSSGSNTTMDANGDRLGYQYDGSKWQGLWEAV